MQASHRDSLGHRASPWARARDVMRGSCAGGRPSMKRETGERWRHGEGGAESYADPAPPNHRGVTYCDMWVWGVSVPVVRRSSIFARVPFPMPLTFTNSCTLLNFPLLVR